MKQKFNIKAKMWFVVCAISLLLGIASVSYAQTLSLTSSEQYWLTYMREEEKLARDVYVVLHEKWQSRIFKNISLSEQTHMDAVKTLLDRYGIEDPAAGKAPGEFTNQELQALYDELIEHGSASLDAALNVGILIGETDIDDLNTAIHSTRRKDMITVYSNLLAGSLNHLDAFNSNPARR